MKSIYARVLAEQPQIAEKERIAIRNAIGAWLRNHADIHGNPPRNFTGNFRLLLTSRSPEWTEVQLKEIDAFIAELEAKHSLSVTQELATQGIALKIQYEKR